MARAVAASTISPRRAAPGSVPGRRCLANAGRRLTSKCAQCHATADPRSSRVSIYSWCFVSIQPLISGQRQELCERVVGGDFVEELAGNLEFVAVAAFHLREFFVEHSAKELLRNLATIAQHPARMSDPLPDLRP